MAFVPRGRVRVVALGVREGRSGQRELTRSSPIPEFQADRPLISRRESMTLARMSSLLRLGSLLLVFSLALLAACSKSTSPGSVDAGADADESTDADVSTDAEVAADAGTDAGPPPCTDSFECVDGDDCTNDSCELDGGVCIHDNPEAACARFDGQRCAGDLATEVLTIDRTFCIPGFAFDDPTLGSFSLCQGQKCDPSDAQDGCLITLTSTGEPATSPDADTLHVAGAVTGVQGSVPFTGVIPDPTSDAGATIPIACSLSLGVGSGLPISADLALMGATACGTDRTVTATADVDLSMLTVQLSGTGFPNAFTCPILGAAIQGQVRTLFTNAEPQIETGVATVLSALDCGTCGSSACAAELVCATP